MGSRTVSCNVASTQAISRISLLPPAALLPPRPSVTIGVKPGDTFGERDGAICDLRQPFNRPKSEGFQGASGGLLSSCDRTCWRECAFVDLGDTPL
jgi:hypothetical protein